MIHLKIAFQLAQLRRLGYAGEGIFAGDPGQRQRRIHQLANTLGTEIARVGAGGALSKEDAHADSFGAGFLQRFDLAQADDGGEFATVHGNGLGGGSAPLHGTTDDVGGNFLQVS